MTTQSAWNTDSWNDFNAGLIEDFRAHNGVATTGRFVGRPLLLEAPRKTRRHRAWPD